MTVTDILHVCVLHGLVYRPEIAALVWGGLGMRVLCALHALVDRLYWTLLD